MNNNRCGPNGGRGDPPRIYGSRGDPPMETDARGRPLWMFGSRGEPPIRSGTRAHLPEVRNTRDGPPIANATRGKPPELKIKRNNSFNDGLISRAIGGQNEPHGRGMPGRDEKGRTSECPLPEGNGKGYHPDLKGNGLQRGYPLPPRFIGTETGTNISASLPARWRSGKQSVVRTRNDEQDFRHEVATYPSPVASPWGYK